MNGHGIRVCPVDPFDDVDLSVAGPVRTKCPKSRPRTRNASGHVVKLERKQHVCVRVVARKTHTVAARGSDIVGGRVHADESALVSVDQAVVLGRRSVDVVHPASSRVGASVESKVVEEVSAEEVFDEAILSSGEGEGPRSSEESKEEAHGGAKMVKAVMGSVANECDDLAQAGP